MLVGGTPNQQGTHEHGKQRQQRHQGSQRQLHGHRQGQQALRKLHSQLSISIILLTLFKMAVAPTAGTMQPSNLTRAIIDNRVRLSVKVLDKETGMDDHRGQLSDVKSVWKID
jgi:hypothetical protein